MSQTGSFFSVCFLDENHLFSIQTVLEHADNRTYQKLLFKVVACGADSGEPFTDLLTLDYPGLITPGLAVTKADTVSPQSAPNQNLLIHIEFRYTMHTFCPRHPRTMIKVFAKQDLIQFSHELEDNTVLPWTRFNPMTTYFGRYDTCTARCNGSQVLLMNKNSDECTLLDFDQPSQKLPGYFPLLKDQEEALEVHGSVPVDRTPQQLLGSFTAPSMNFKLKKLDSSRMVCVDIVRDGLLMFVSGT